MRQLIEERRIPQDVTIQVLTQAREDLILRTFESLRDAHRATVHLYNATAPLFRELVFGMNKEQVVELATRATRLIRQQCEQQPQTRWQYEYSRKPSASPSRNSRWRFAKRWRKSGSPAPNGR